jgi:hypothetical protein
MLNESPRVVGGVGGNAGINSTRTLHRLLTARLTAPGASCVFLLLCWPSMMPAISCYRGGPKRWATLGGTRDLMPEGAGGGLHVFDGNVEVDLWALFPWLWHSKIHVTTSVLLLMQCSIAYVLFIYAVTNVSKGVHSCRTLFITVGSSFGPFFGPSSDLNTKTHETNYINCLYTLEKKTSSSTGLTTARN